MSRSKLDKQAQMVLQEAKEVLKENDEKDLLPALSSLSAIHQRFVHMYLSGKYTTAKLAEIFDVHPNTIVNWVKRPDVQSAIIETQNVTNIIVTQQLSAMSSKAVNRLIDLMDSPTDMVALMAVRDVLDRSGHKPKSEIKIDKTVRTFEQKISDLIEETVEDIDYEVVDDK